MGTVAFVAVLTNSENNPPGARTEKMTCLGGPVITDKTSTVGGGAVAQKSPVGEPEHVAKVVFELTVPPFIVATMVSPANDVNEKGAVNVNVAIPKAFVKALPLRPASGPAVTVKVTSVFATGTPFDKTTAVLVMEEPGESHIIEEFTGETTTDGPVEDPPPSMS